MVDNVAIVTNAYGALAKGDINTFLGMLDERSNGTCPNIIHYGQARHSWDSRRFSKVTSLESVKSMTDFGSISSESLRLATRCWSRCGVEARGR
jgi:hypothetical protein